MSWMLTGGPGGPAAPVSPSFPFAPWKTKGKTAYWDIVISEKIMKL